MGVTLVRDKIGQTAELTGEPFPDELRLRLEHMIVSHHGSHEFGSPKLPMTPEAIALHHLDNMDAKVHLFTREIRDDPAREASWTPYNASLGRRLFKGAPALNGKSADEEAQD
jgi:3'-5' exoribonuclease